MARQILAATIDTALVAALSFAGFRLVNWALPCPNPSECPLLTPLVILAVIAFVVAYFGGGFLLWRSTFGQRVAGTGGTQ